MELIAIMKVYHLTASAAKHMLETLSQDKIDSAVEDYWRRAERSFNDRECSC